MFHTPEGVDPSRLTGLFVDELIERIPHRDHTAGIAFHYDQPNRARPATWFSPVPPLRARRTLALGRRRRLDRVGARPRASPRRRSRSARRRRALPPRDRPRVQRGGQDGEHRPVAVRQHRRGAVMASVTHWGRLEPRCRTDDFAEGLRAEVRDPLWMLARQWQLGEFDADDGGSPVVAEVAYAASAIESYRARSGAAVPVDDASGPARSGGGARAGAARPADTRPGGPPVRALPGRRGAGRVLPAFVDAVRRLPAVARRRVRRRGGALRGRGRGARRRRRCPARRRARQREALVAHAHGRDRHDRP